LLRVVVGFKSEMRPILICLKTRQAIALSMLTLGRLRMVCSAVGRGTRIMIVDAILNAMVMLQEGIERNGKHEVLRLRTNNTLALLAKGPWKDW
jgi:hypothetical protein